MIAGKGYSDATRLLLRHGANLDARGPRNMASLHWSVYNDHANVLEILLDHEADADMRDDGGWASIHGVVSAGFSKSTNLLIEKA